MSKLICFYKLNYSTIFRYSWGIFAALLAICSPFQSYYVQGVFYIIIAEVGLLLAALFIASIWVLFNKENTIAMLGIAKISISYGDLFKTAFSEEKEQGLKRIVVIPVNTCFDTIVDEDIARVKKPLVSPGSIHGKWIKQVSKTLHVDEIDQRIADSLKDKTFRLILPEQKERGKLKDYDFGTVAVFDYGSTEFFLLALSRFDSNNNAQCSKDEFIVAMQRLIDYIDTHGQALPVYIPLMGTGLSRANMNHKESLQAMVALMKLYANKLKSNINIIIYDGDRDKVSIYDVK